MIDTHNLPIRLRQETTDRLGKLLEQEKALPQYFGIYMLKSTRSSIYRLVFQTQFNSVTLTELTKFIPEMNQLIATEHLWSHLSDNLRLCFSKHGNSLRQIIKCWEDTYLQQEGFDDIYIDRNMFPSFKHYDVLPPISIDLGVQNIGVEKSSA